MHDEALTYPAVRSSEAADTGPQRNVKKYELTVCVYCGSRLGRDPRYRAAAAQLGRGLAERGITLVYGGGHVGTMGVLSDAALNAGGRVIGVIPRHLDKREIGHRGVSELFIVETMHERKAKMAQLSDAFVILPGGLGTLDETLEILTWKQIGLIEATIILVDLNHYWRDLLVQLQRACDEDFVRPHYLELMDRCETVAAAIERLERLAPDLKKRELSKA